MALDDCFRDRQLRVFARFCRKSTITSALSGSQKMRGLLNRAKLRSFTVRIYPKSPAARLRLDQHFPSALYYAGREPIRRTVRYSCVKNPFCPCPAQWPKVARRSRRWRSSDALCRAQFLPVREEDPSRNYHRLRSGDDVFIRTMGNLLGPPLLKGNKVTALENGDQIFPALLEAIRSAQRTITFENFLFAEGEVSDAFAEALAERARAG